MSLPRASLPVLATGLLLSLPGCDPGVPAAPARSLGPVAAEADPPPCLDPGDPSEEAYETVTGPTGGRVLLPNGRALTPAGTQVTVGMFPLNVVAGRDGRYVFVTTTGDGPDMVQQIDVASRSVVASLTLKHLFNGLALSPAGDTLYATVGEDGLVAVIAVGDPGLTLVQTFSLSGWPAAVAVAPDGRRLLVSVNLDQAVVEMDPDNGAVLRRFPMDHLPYQVLYRPDGQRAWVSQSYESQVSVINLTTGRVEDPIPTGKNPAGMALSPSGFQLLVASSDGDVLESFDAESGARTGQVEVGAYRDGLRGVSPNSLAYSPDGTRVYLANAGDNAVEVYDPRTLAHLGAIPTGWYPAAVALTPAGDTLAVVNAKGEGAGPSPDGIQPSKLMEGTVSLIPVPLTSEALAAGAAQVVENNARPRTLHEVSCEGKLFPIPSEGMTSPIEHVVIVVRENKTYDAYLGDLEVGDGDPSLVLFGEEVTPNTHALAREFTLLDNFYDDSEDSDQGHLWVTSAFVNDYSERFNAAGRTLLTGVGRPTDPETKYIFDALQRAGVDWINYGEVVGMEVATFRNIDLNYPGVFFNTNVKDEAKASYVASRVADGVMPSFTFIGLPNDHTEGTTPGELSPESMVSDNDYGLGILVDAISHSEFWPRTVIFVLQDDTQDGADHVDAHRSPTLVISPWAKRGHVSSVHYSIPSILRTAELILGVPPMTQFDAMALPLYDAFTAVPDERPFEVLPRQIPDTYNTRQTVGAAQSLKMDFSGPDRARGLGEVLWRYRKGTEPPPMFGLRSDGDADDDADEGSDEGDWTY